MQANKMNESQPSLYRQIGRRYLHHSLDIFLVIFDHGLKFGQAAASFQSLILQQSQILLRLCDL